ncbi:MAG: hypothetical protein GF372_13195 [Candidatus Marinimicrobia bacterium]|nr:hypothetical protein [Candidatus Neomarinimicrobiota bacterium]
MTLRICIQLLLCAVFFFSQAGGLHSESTVLEITVRAGEHERINTPVSLNIIGAISANVSGLELYETTAGANRVVPSQILASETTHLCWILDGNTPAGGERTFALKSGIRQLHHDDVIEIEMSNSALTIGTSGQRSVTYNYGLIPPPEVNSDLYVRSGFIHPIRTPDGKVLTRIHPSDHIHHMGFWNPWTKTVFEGREVDFWNLGDGQGTVRFKKFTELYTGAVVGGFEALHQYIDLTAPGGEKAALNELWDVRVWNIPDTPDAWVWDFTTTQWTAGESPLEILKYRYGGFGFRGTADWNEQNSNYLTSEGKTREDGNGTRAKWCDVHGITDQGPAGLIFMNHPVNREFPEPMRIWPQGDVYFGYCPVVESGFTIQLGQKYIRKYRVYVYDGEITPEQAERLWQDFGHPPEIEITGHN